MITTLRLKHVFHVCGVTLGIYTHAQCGDILRLTTQTHSTPEYITKNRVLFGFRNLQRQVFLI